MITRWRPLPLLGALALLWCAPPPVGAEQTVLIPEGAPWRVFARAARFKKHSYTPEGYSPKPPQDWKSAAFDDSGWGRYAESLDEAIGEYGHGQSHQISLLCLRTRFGVTDPSAAGKLKLSLEYRGGVVVYVNGKEVARKDLPEGELELTTQADAYPPEAFKDPEGNRLRRTGRPAEKFRDRYEKRIRTLTARLPASALRKGSNVLALEVHAAPLVGMRLSSRDVWATAGLCSATLSSPSGRGVVAWSDATDEVLLWNASPMETVAVKPGPYRSGFLWWKITKTPAGLTRGNPFDPLRPIRTVAPRGGTCSGQVVLSAPEPLGGLRASVGPLRAADGKAAIPSGNVQVRFATQPEWAEFCNALQPAPDPEAPVQPVWVVVDVPRDQQPGWYTGTLKVELAEPQAVAKEVPVQVLVSPWTVPDPKDNATLVSMYPSPETLADHYKVDPWSDEHFKLIEASFRAMRKSGNDVLLVPVIRDDYLHHKDGLIRWVKRGDGRRPEFSAFERYLDLHIEAFGKPKVITLLVWKHAFGCRTWFRGMNSKTVEPCMVTELDPKTGKMKPMKAPHFGKPGSEKFWGEMLQGVRKRIKQRGCSDEFLLLGEVFDSRPLEPTVKFFKKIAPEWRWQGYAHWVREPKPVNGKFICHGGLEIGFKIGPNGGGLPELSRHWPEKTPPKREYLIAQAERVSIHFESSPLSYRAVMYRDRDGGGTLARIGLDAWPSYRDDRGRLRSRYASPPKEGWLWRGHCPTLTAPGPDGAVRTVQGQMLLEGIQETELMVQFARVLAEGEPEQIKKVTRARARRDEAMFVGNTLSQATISLDWFGIAAAEYALAAELAGVKDAAVANLWNSPPPAEGE